MSDTKQNEDRDITESRILNKIRILSRDLNNLSKLSRGAASEPAQPTKNTPTNQPGKLPRVTLTGEERAIMTYCSDRK